ncbi:TPA: hypothetical protein ACIR5Y_003931 [Enterobacter hormaechei]
MHIVEDIYLDEYGLRRKKFVYDQRIHHCYLFMAGSEVYAVIMGALASLNVYSDVGYELPPGIEFPANGMAEVYFDVLDGNHSLAAFRHVGFEGLGSAVVLQKVSLALISHFETFNIGGFVFQAASGGVVDIGRRTSLEETYDYMLGLKSKQRFNKNSGLPKKTPRVLLPQDLSAHKLASEGTISYVVRQ